MTTSVQQQQQEQEQEESQKETKQLSRIPVGRISSSKWDTILPATNETTKQDRAQVRSIPSFNFKSSAQKNDNQQCVP